MYFNKKLGIYLILIGLGMGIIIGSIVNILNPTITYLDYTDEEIRSRAEELGMIDLKENIENNMEESKKQINTLEEKGHINENGMIIFEIKKGETSEIIIDNLFETNLINDRSEFETYVFEEKVAKKFKYGIYEIEENTDYSTLIEILTK